MDTESVNETGQVKFSASSDSEELRISFENGYDCGLAAAEKRYSKIRKRALNFSSIFYHTPAFSKMDEYDYIRNPRIISSFDTRISYTGNFMMTFEIKGTKGDLYTTTLYTCSCPDFQRTHQPCKHMMHLATDLGILSFIDTAPIKSAIDVLSAERLRLADERERAIEKFYDQQNQIDHLHSRCEQYESDIVQLRSECSKHKEENARLHSDLDKMRSVAKTNAQMADEEIRIHHRNERKRHIAGIVALLCLAVGLTAAIAFSSSFDTKSGSSSTSTYSSTPGLYTDNDIDKIQTTYYNAGFGKGYDAGYKDAKLKYANGTAPSSEKNSTSTSVKSNTASKGDATSKSSNTVSTPLPPANATVLYKAEDLGAYTSGITIHTPDDSDCVVKLKYHSSGETAYAFYVKAGRNVDKPIPPGTYDVCFAFGNEWHTYSYLFGKDTVCSVDKNITFTYGSSWEYTLYPVADGNLDLDDLDLDEMLKD